MIYKYIEHIQSLESKKSILIQSINSQSFMGVGGHCRLLITLALIVFLS